MLFKFGKVKSLIYSFCNLSEETRIYKKHVHFNQIFGEELVYSFKFILLSSISCHSAPFLAIWKKCKVNII